MSAKDILILIVSYCSLKFADKLIEDNLPNLHYKNLITGFYKYIAPYLLLAALDYFALRSNLSKDKEVQKTYLILLTIVIAAFVLQKAIAENKKPSTNN